MTKTPTKISRIIDHLRSGLTITQLEAIGLYGAYRLAARIKELRQKGWVITTTNKRDHNGDTYAEYKMVSEPNLNPHGLPDFALPDAAQRGAAKLTPAPASVDAFRS